MIFARFSFSLRPVTACLAALALAGGPPSTVRAETLTLVDCLRETAAHNPAILAAQKQIERATATRLTLRARALPSLTVGGVIGYQGKEDAEELRVRTKNAAGQRETVTVTGARPAQFIAIGEGGLTQAIFDASIPASWRRGTVGILAAKEDFYTVASTELYLARTQFYRALYQQERGKVLHEVDAILGANVDAQSSLVNAGLRGRQSLLSAQVERSNFNPAILGATGNYRSDLAILLQTMGREPGTGPHGADPLMHIALGGSLDEGAFEFDAAAAGKDALAHRPDLLALRAQVRAGTEDARIVRAGYYPLVRVYVAGELLPENFVRSNQPNAIRSTDQVQTTEVRPGVREDWVVIDTGAVRGAARQIDAVREALEINLHRLEQNIPGELAAVRSAVGASSETLDALRCNVNTAQSTLNIVNAGLAQGLNSQLEFLDAQSGLLSTRVGLLEASLDLSLARAEFDRITGRYVRYVSDESPAAAPAARPTTPK